MQDYPPIPFVVLGDGHSFVAAALNWNPAGGAVRQEHPPQAGRYIAILQVGDYGKLSIAHSGTDITTLVPDAIKVDLQVGRALLVLDLSNEGPDFHEGIFADFHGQIQDARIPAEAVMFVAQNRLLPDRYRAVFGDAGLQFGIYDFFIKFVAATLDESYAIRLFGTLVDPEQSALAHPDDALTYLCLNATPRWHRVLVYRWLQLRGLLPAGLVSFHGANPDNPKAPMLDYVNLPEAVRRDFPELFASVEEWMPAAAVTVGDATRRGNELTQSIETDLYRRTLFSIVTESDFFVPGIRRLTEKAIKAAGMGHPFVIVGNPSSIALLRELGFRTFDATSDHRYDLEADPTRRLNMAFEEVMRQIRWIDADRGTWLNLNREDSAFNHHHARSGGLMKAFETTVEDKLLESWGQFIGSPL